MSSPQNELPVPVIILSVEDDPAAALLVEDTLTLPDEQGYQGRPFEVHTVPDLQSALTYLDRAAAGEIPAPDAVVTDYELSRADEQQHGGKVVEAVRRHFGAAVPVIGFAAHPMDRVGVEVDRDVTKTGLFELSHHIGTLLLQRDTEQALHDDSQH